MKQANSIKLQVKKLFLNIDTEKKGEIKTDVFFNLLSLYNINLDG
jgi:hypothetical protein